MRFKDIITKRERRAAAVRAGKRIREEDKETSNSPSLTKILRSSAAAEEEEKIRGSADRLVGGGEGNQVAPPMYQKHPPLHQGNHHQTIQTHPNVDNVPGGPGTRLGPNGTYCSSRQ